VTDPTSDPDGERSRPTGLRWSNWNLSLAVPFLALVTPLFNHTEPVLFGWPFFYWGYLVAVIAGCACIGAMVCLTGDRKDAGTAGTGLPK
jgi:hypothetical protein